MIHDDSAVGVMRRSAEAVHSTVFAPETFVGTS